MKLDTHMHSTYSPDSFNSLKAIRKKERKIGVVPIIADHNTMQGNLKYKCLIPAMEINAKEGEVIGYFLTEEIRKGLSVIETIEKIKELDGISCIPHPFDTLRRSALRDPELCRKADLIEGFNARVYNQEHNRKAFDFAREFGKGITSGSDSHFPWEFGKSYIEIDPFDSPKEFMKNLRGARHFGKPTSVVYTLAGGIYWRLFKKK